MYLFTDLHVHASHLNSIIEKRVLTLPFSNNKSQINSHIISSLTNLNPFNLKCFVPSQSLANISTWKRAHGPLFQTNLFTYKGC